MSEQINPLQQAQTLVAELQQKVGEADSSTLRSELARLQDLLNQAAIRGEGADADEARQLLQANIDNNASFSSMMVHEIRKPMTSIRGYADMLAKPGMVGPMNPMQQQMIDTVRTNIIRMEGLVTDISDIGKLRANRIKLDNKMTTFSQIIMDVKKQAEPLNAELQHNIEWDIPQGLPFLNADGKQIAKVLGNLVKNAIQYTPKGSGHIVVKAENIGNNRLRVSVTDNGIGMKPEEIARLGEVFYRADHELVTSQKGYGLGIPIAIGFLELMNSKLDTESNYGAGSTFGFVLEGMG